MDVVDYFFQMFKVGVKLGYYYLSFYSRLRRLTGQNESKVDNINSANTPTALEMKYKEFYDHARMDAVDHIETFRSQKDTERGSIKDGIMAEYVACIIFEVN